MGYYEAQEGRDRRQARQALREDDQEHRGRGPDRRRRRVRQPDAVRRHPEGEEEVGPEAGGADYETIMYEGYGPNGVAVLIECLTDNRNRAASDVRVAMTRNGG